MNLNKGETGQGLKLTVLINSSGTVGDVIIFGIWNYLREEHQLS